MAGLLARFAFDDLPVPINIETVVQERSKACETYSIGECSGFSPDSRFNPPSGGTKCKIKIEEA